MGERCTKKIDKQMVVSRWFKVYDHGRDTYHYEKCGDDDRWGDTPAFTIFAKLRNNNPGLKIWIYEGSNPLFSLDERGFRLRDNSRRTSYGDDDSRVVDDLLPSPIQADALRAWARRHDLEADYNRLTRMAQAATA